MTEHAPRDWDRAFLQLLKGSRSSYDQPPDWRAALGLYDGLGFTEAAGLDAALVAMIDEEYRNPYSAKENLPFDDLMVNLPAGMVPDDLLCLEAAVLVTAERGVGAALFPFNRLLRAPRWHALYPRLIWLGHEAVSVQRRLASTAAGRYLGALVGMALAEGLRPTPSGVPEAGPWGEITEQALRTAAERPASGPAAELKPPLRQLVEAALSGEVPPSSAWESHGLGSSLEETLLGAVNLPSEHRASIGALAGAIFGPLAAPRPWTGRLGDRTRLESAAEAYYLSRRPTT